jgi:hypothetical protein
VVGVVRQKLRMSKRRRKNRNRNNLMETKIMIWSRIMDKMYEFTIHCLYMGMVNWAIGTSA